MKNILIADDHWIVRMGLKMLVNKIYDTANVVGVNNGDEVIRALKNDPYDLILLDLMMPETDAIELLNLIQSHNATIPVLIVTMNPEESYGKRFLQLGAKGFIKKNAPEEELIRAIKQVSEGRKYISTELADTISEDFFSGRSSNPFDALSAREFQITSYLCKGVEITEICKVLSIQYSTVNTHKQRIFDKLNIRTIKELAELAMCYSI